MSAARKLVEPQALYRQTCACAFVGVREHHGRLVCSECGAPIVPAGQPRSIAEERLLRAQRRVQRCRAELADALEELAEAKC